MASRHCVDGVVLSNHGGRQLDGALSSLDILADTVSSTPKEFVVLIDGGIRRGSDIAKAMGGSGGGDSRFAQGGVEGVPKSVPDLRAILLNRLSA